MVKKKKILILSYYFQPDLCAGSFRCTSFIEQLMLCNQDEYQIDLITTMPNRYASFSMQAAEEETHESVDIKRILLPPHKSAVLGQTRGFIHYAREVFKITKNQDYCLVFATSSRLMTAVLGAYISRNKKAKLYLDIRDIFLDTFNDAFPKIVKLFCKPFISYIEKWTFNQADRINLVSKGFLGYFNKRYTTHDSYHFHTNGIDKEFIGFASTTQSNAFKKPYTVLYAGNIGEGQGLHLILPELAKKLSGIAQFKIIGDGGRRLQLESELQGIDNIKLILPVSREALLEEYRKADVLFLHLNNYPAFRKVLPSKLFEYAATGKPIIAGVSGYCAEFIKQEISNAKIFSPCDSSGAYESFFELDFQPCDRSHFIQIYSREKIMQSMAKDVLNCVASVSKHNHG